jgi:hypothetical protein
MVVGPDELLPVSMAVGDGVLDVEEAAGVGCVLVVSVPGIEDGCRMSGPVKLAAGGVWSPWVSFGDCSRARLLAPPLLLAQLTDCALPTSVCALLGCML